MSFARTQLYDAPFPSDDLRNADGTINLGGITNSGNVVLIKEGLALLAGRVGFATSAALYLSTEQPIDPKTLPSLQGSVGDDASVYILNVDARSPEYLTKSPAEITFEADGGPFGAPNLLVVLPLQGLPLRPNTLYAAVVTKAVHDVAGHSLGVAPAAETLLSGRAPAGLNPTGLASYQKAVAALQKKSPAAGIVALSAFTTGDPTAEMNAAYATAMAAPLPSPSPSPALTDAFDDYCVFQTTIDMPDYQAGTPPYAKPADGGGWIFNAQGELQQQRLSPSSVFYTIPRAPMPSPGYPVVLFVRTGGGGNRPLVDRGPQPATGQPALVPGTGPALLFAHAGFAGVEVDGPLGGLRNPAMDDEEFLIFNVNNPTALRDNVRESALELMVFAHVLSTISFDVSACPQATVVGGGPAHFDLTHLTIMGHSTGAWITPLAVATEPRFTTAMLSGAGGSWVENIVWKAKPLEVRPLAELLLGYTLTNRVLDQFDPALMITQWAVESADPQVYTKAIIDAPPSGAAPRNVLMMQGIVDHYILPRIANATSLSTGLDLAGTPLDHDKPDLVGQLPLEAIIGLGGHSSIGFPVSANRTVGNATATAVVTQFPEDGIEDGHEVVFQTEAPKHVYQCFLESLLAGHPTVVAGAPIATPCPSF